MKIIVLETTSWHKKVRLELKGHWNESDMKGFFRGKKKGQLRLKKKVIGKVLNENVKVVLEMLSDSRASRPRAFARNKLYG